MEASAAVEESDDDIARASPERRVVVLSHVPTLISTPMTGFGDVITVGMLIIIFALVRCPKKVVRASSAVYLV